MNKKYKNGIHCRGGDGHRRRGPSSYGMQNSDLIFKSLGLQLGGAFLDLGCGPGDYSIHAARDVGESGKVHAYDCNDSVLEQVRIQAMDNGLKNITTFLGDMTEILPFENCSVDICFMGTSLHCMDLNKCGNSLFKEVRRVLKPSGQVAVLECKKENADFGPPMHMRISGDKLRAVAESLGFIEAKYVDFGFNYLICFAKN